MADHIDQSRIEGVIRREARKIAIRKHSSVSYLDPSEQYLRESIGESVKLKFEEGSIEHLPGIEPIRDAIVAEFTASLDEKLLKLDDLVDEVVIHAFWRFDVVDSDGTVLTETREG